MTGFPVGCNNHSFKTVWFHFFTVMRYNIFANKLYTFGRFQKYRHFSRFIAQGSFRFFVQIIRQLIKRNIYLRLINMNIQQARLKMKWKRGFIAYGILKSIAAQVAAFILFGTKSPEGVFIGFVYRRSG